MIIGSLDGSLSSSGICFADCVFKEEYKQVLSDILFNEEINKEYYDRFSEIFHILYTNEIKEDKDAKKLLAKSRKRIREINPPSFDDIVLEEGLCINRLIHQTDEILSNISEYKPILMVMEDYAYSSKGSIVQMAELKGALKSDMFAESFWVLWKDYAYVNIPLKSVKKLVGMNGNANKEMIFLNLQRFGIEVLEKEDDRNDAIAINISTFIAIYFRIFGLNIPESKDKKRKNSLKSFEISLNTMANRFGTRDEVLKRFLIDIG